MRMTKKDLDIKFTIIIPTYNDADTIKFTINSVINQTYKNWEIIIMNDGSTDNTENILTPIIENNTNIRYFYQENADQLNAILNSIPYITGDYIIILHSDDILSNDNTLMNCVNYFKNNHCDAIIGNLEVMDENGNKIGFQKVSNYKKREYIKATLLLWLGRNLFVDTAVFEKNFFLSQVKESYLTWNMPFWLLFDNNPKMSNVHKVDFSLISYRVFSGNYINNELGKLNVINGELRTALFLMNFYYIPFFKIQYYCFRIFNKLKITEIYQPFFRKKSSSKKAKLIEYILKKRFDNYNNYEYFKALLNFYKHKNSRKINLIIDNLKLYYGKDMRTFNKKMLNGELEDFYYNIFSEMEKGFSTITINKEGYNDLLVVLKFLGIYYDVNIEISEE